MNRAATEDVRSPVWPVVSRVLRTRRRRPNAARPAGRSTCSTTGSADDAPRLDADDDGHYDDAGPTIMDALWRPIAEAVDGAGVRRPARRPRRRPQPRTASPASPTSTRTCARCSASGVDGPLQPPLLRRRRPRRVPRVAVGRGRRQAVGARRPTTARRPGRAGAGTPSTHRLRPGPASPRPIRRPPTGRPSSRCSSSSTAEPPAGLADRLAGVGRLGRLAPRPPALPLGGSPAPGSEPGAGRCHRCEYLSHVDSSSGSVTLPTVGSERPKSTG